jgi:hypothetical protein
MGNARFDDEIGPALPDQFLDGVEILRHLDHRPAKPGEILGVGMPDRFPDPGVRQFQEIAVLADPADVVGDEVSEVLIWIQGSFSRC